MSVQALGRLTMLAVLTAASLSNGTGNTGVYHAAMSVSRSTLSPLKIGNLLSWPAQHIRWKIVLPYAFLTVLLAAAGGYLATPEVTGSLTERFDNQLAE